MKNRPDPADPRTISDLAALRARGLTALRTRAKAGDKRAIAFIEARKKGRAPAPRARATAP